MSIHLRRVYDPPASDSDYQVLVDRIWPRGVAKSEVNIDRWLKDAAPSTQLRKAFHEQRISWSQFRSAYLHELKQHREELRPLAQRGRGEVVTLLFSAKDRDHNNAVVLKQYLQMLK